LTRPAIGTFAITTRRKRKGAAFTGDAPLDAVTRGAIIAPHQVRKRIYEADTGVNA
jgi:hypothetical protein